MSDIFDVPNPWGLPATDFDYDARLYTAAMAFLGDVSCGVPEDQALVANGGDPQMRRGWDSSRRFRRALARARELGELERARDAQHAADPFSTIPLRGAPDPSTITLDDRGLRGLLHRVQAAIGPRRPAPAVSETPAAPPSQRFIPVTELTDADLTTMRLQNAPPPAPARLFSDTPDPASWGGPGTA